MHMPTHGHPISKVLDLVTDVSLLRHLIPHMYEFWRDKILVNKLPWWIIILTNKILEKACRCIVHLEACKCIVLTTPCMSLYNV